MPHRVRLQLVSDDPQANEIAELYWEQDEEGAFVNRVAEIAEIYGLSSREVLQVVNEAAIAESEARLCSECGSGRRVRSRSEASNSPGMHRFGPFVCDECALRRDAEKREAERKLIAEHYVVPDEPLVAEAADLSLKEAVGLYALIRQCAAESYSRLDPVRTASQPIAPFEFVFDLLRTLNSRILWVDPDSDSGAFVWETGEPERFYLEQVRWLVPGPAGELDRLAFELRTIFEEKLWPAEWEAEAPALQRAIAANELAAYLIARLDEHHFPFSPGTKTWEILNSMAGSRPIGEGFNLIWRAARDAAAFSVREGCSAKRAAAYAINTLGRSFERAETQGWSVKPFARDWDLPRSEVAHVFYELYLGVSNEMLAAPLTAPPSEPSD